MLKLNLQESKEIIPNPEKNLYEVESKANPLDRE